MAASIAWKPSPAGWYAPEIPPINVDVSVDRWLHAFALCFLPAHGDLCLYRRCLVSVPAGAIACVDASLLFHEIWYTAYWGGRVSVDLIEDATVVFHIFRGGAF